MHSIQRRTRYLRGIRVFKTYLAPIAVAAISLNCSNSPTEPQEAVLIPYHDSAGLAGAAKFGVMASSSFQNNWQNTLPYAWNNAWGFWNQGNVNMNGMWAYQMNGAQGRWQQPPSFSDNVNSVDFFFAETHGSAWTGPYNAAYFMWDQNTVAVTTNMRLTRTGGFFTFSCDTQKNDGGIWDRWSPVFQGGLRIATGGWDLLFDSPFTDDTGSNFAQYFENNEAFAYAWENAVESLWEPTSAPSTMVSGVSVTDCTNRLYGMTAFNVFSSYPKLTDKVVYLCWYQVQN
jgi:hypothetical protein